MNKLALFALFAMASLAQAIAMDRYGAGGSVLKRYAADGSIAERYGSSTGRVDQAPDAINLQPAEFSTQVGGAIHTGKDVRFSRFERGAISFRPVDITM